MSYLIPWTNGDKAIAYFLGRKNPALRFFYDATGYTQKQNTEYSTSAQIRYNDYIAGGNARALADWNKNVGSKGLSGSHPRIKYPELSYAGRIYQANTATARAMYDADTARANYYGNIPYRGAGLYGIASRVSRWL